MARTTAYDSRPSGGKMARYRTDTYGLCLWNRGLLCTAPRSVRDGARTQSLLAGYGRWACVALRTIEGPSPDTLQRIRTCSGNRHGLRYPASIQCSKSATGLLTVNRSVPRGTRERSPRPGSNLSGLGEWVAESKANLRRPTSLQAADFIITNFKELQIASTSPFTTSRFSSHIRHRRPRHLHFAPAELSLNHQTRPSLAGVEI